MLIGVEQSQRPLLKKRDCSKVESTTGGICDTATRKSLVWSTEVPVEPPVPIVPVEPAAPRSWAWARPPVAVSEAARDDGREDERAKSFAVKHEGPFPAQKRLCVAVQGRCPARAAG